MAKRYSALWRNAHVDNWAVRIESDLSVYQVTVILRFKRAVQYCSLSQIFQWQRRRAERFSIASGRPVFHPNRTVSSHTVKQWDSGAERQQLLANSFIEWSISHQRRWTHLVTPSTLVLSRWLASTDPSCRPKFLALRLRETSEDFVLVSAVEKVAPTLCHWCRDVWRRCSTYVKSRCSWSMPRSMAAASAACWLAARTCCCLRCCSSRSWAVEQPQLFRHRDLWHQCPRLPAGPAGVTAHRQSAIVADVGVGRAADRRIDARRA